MVRIAITVEAFEAIARTLPLGNVGYENKIDERGTAGPMHPTDLRPPHRRRLAP
jgi:hypothetical protein